MRFRPCTVTVTQLPEKLDMKQGRLFFNELESRMNIDRPCVVLDCSKVRAMDRFAIHMLLCCLEEAMKRDGDVKLAAVSPSARETLELTRVDRLFEIYDTETDAVNSFFRPHYERALYARGIESSDEISESAA
jgi:anti-anti-sigma factor